MKRIFGIGICLFFVLLNGLRAQGCPGVTVAPFVMNETSSVTYWGVQVTLATENLQSNVTVTGVILDVENRTISQPFTVVVPIGNLTAQTDEIVLQTGLARSTEVTITSVTPCPEDLEITRIFSAVGDVHNNGLNAVLNGLKTRFGSVYQGGNSLQDHNYFLQVVDSLLYTFLKTELAVQSSDLHFINTTIAANANGNDVRSYGSNSLITIVNNLPEGQNLSSELKFAISQLSSLIDDQSRNTIKSEFDALVSVNISRILSTKEKEYFSAMASTAYSSINYWDNNFSEWAAFFGGSSQSAVKTQKVTLISSLGFKLWKDKILSVFGRGKNIAVADAAGVVTGAIGGCAYGALGGTVVLGPVGTVVGCAGVGALGALGGGLGNSTKKAVEEFFDWLF